MATLDNYRQIISDILTEYTKVPYAYGDIQFETVFDFQNDRYLLMIVGWENEHRTHGCLIHIDIIDGKIWIQRDGTERGVANELIKVGIPNDKIVLGFRSAEMRKYTEFAVA